MPLQSDTPKNDRPRLPICIRKKLRRVRRTTGLKATVTASSLRSGSHKVCDTALDVVQQGRQQIDQKWLASQSRTALAAPGSINSSARSARSCGGCRVGNRANDLAGAVHGAR